MGESAFCRRFSMISMSIVWQTSLKEVGLSAPLGKDQFQAAYQQVGGVRMTVDGGYTVAKSGNGQLPHWGLRPLPRICDRSSDGKTEIFGTPLGGSNNDFASSVVLDAAGKIYIVGKTSSTQYFLEGNVRYNDIPNYPINNHGAAGYGLSNFPTTTTAYSTNTPESKNYAGPDSVGNVIGPTDEQAFVTVFAADLGSMT